jgi:hypothetical protein
VTGREVRGKRAVLKKELVTLSVGKWWEDELKDALAASSMPRGTSTGPCTGMEPKENMSTGKTG